MRLWLHDSRLRGSFAGLTAIWILAALTSSVHAAGITVGPYPQNPTPSGITVCWVTERATIGTVSVTPADRAGTAAVSASDATPVQYHRVRIEGLNAYTRYRYRVACDGATADGSFRTAPTAGHDFKFVAYGDNRTQPDRHAAVLARVKQFQPDFIIQTGDQVADGRSEYQWSQFWQVASPVLRDFPYYPELGNHEREGAPYFKYFGVPAEYSFDYGNTHFVGIDSNRPKDEYSAQEEWLKKDLAAHQQARWRVVFMHHTVYTCVNMPDRKVLSDLLRARLEPILLSEHVQLVISGHDHTYQHHFARGIHYIVTGGGGAPLYGVTPDTPHVVKAKSAYHDCEITVSNKGIGVRAVEPDGSTIEAFTIR